MSETLTSSAPASAPVSTPDPTPPAPVSAPVETITPATSEPWYGQLPEPLTVHQKFLDQFKDRDTFIKSAADTKAALSKKLEGFVKLPGENATPEELSAYRKAVGVPDDPTGYEVTAPEVANLPGFDPEALGPIKEAAHALGLSADQFNGLVAAQAKIEAAQLEAMQQAERSLVNEWGDQYDYRVADIAARVGDVIDLEQPFLNRTDVLRALDLLAADFRPDSTNTGQSSANLQSLDEQIAAIQSSPAYRNTTDPGHKAAREKLHSLYREQSAREVATRR